MHRLLWIVWFVPATLIAWIVVCWTGVLPRPTDAQRAALEILSQPERPIDGGKNAFANFWFIHYDIPQSDRAALLRKDVGRAEHLVADGDSLADFAPGVPEGAKTETLTSKDKEALCHRGEDVPCLSKVRTN